MSGGWCPSHVLNIRHREGNGQYGGRFGDRHTSGVDKLATDYVADVVSFSDDFFAVVVNQLRTFDGQFNKQDGTVDDKGNRFFYDFVAELTIEFAESITELVDLLNRISEEVEAPKDSRDGEDFRSKSVCFSGIDCGSFDELNCGSDGVRSLKNVHWFDVEN